MSLDIHREVIRQTEEILREEWQDREDLERKINAFKFDYLCRYNLIEYDSKDTREGESSYVQDALNIKTYGLKTKIIVEFKVKITEEMLKLFSILKEEQLSPLQYELFSTSDNERIKEKMDVLRKRVSETAVNEEDVMVKAFRTALGKYMTYTVDDE